MPRLDAKKLLQDLDPASAKEPALVEVPPGSKHWVLWNREYTLRSGRLLP